MTELCSHPFRRPVNTSCAFRVSRQSDQSTLIVGRSLAPIENTRERLVVVAARGERWCRRRGRVPRRAGWCGSASARSRRWSGRQVEITDTELDRRVPGANSSTEVGHLASAINRMLDRLQVAFDQREQDLVTLQESEARMRQFVGDASHELRTPIAATAAYAELFERGARDRPDDLERAMTGIRTETARMADLVEDLLLLAQLDEGRPLAQIPVDLAGLAIEAVDAANALAPDRPVSLRVDDVPVVVGDPSRLRQVLDNLLANVRTHTPPETPCSLSVGRDGDDAVITVADQGPGMPDDDLARAFDRFHRADTSRARASGGAGLGLSIVAAIVAAHHGSVGMLSSLGVGTTVTVRLPIEKETP